MRLPEVLRLSLRKWTRGTLWRPETLAFLPALTLSAFWLGGEALLLGTALLLPLIIALIGPFEAHGATEISDPVSGLAMRDQLIEALDHALAEGERTGKTTACLVLCIDDLDQVTDRYGHAGFAQIMRRTADRVHGALRGSDLVARLEGANFAVAISPMRHASLDMLMQIALRLQSAVQAPVTLDAATVYISASVGFCLEGRTVERTGEKLLDAAEAAMLEARRAGPSAVRAWTGEMQAAKLHRHNLAYEVEAALDSGQIRPFFQPQISTDTGEISGFEALARWIHPEHGVVPPAEFVPAIQSRGLCERLGEVVLYHSLTAIRSWDRAGLCIPSVSVNVSADELRNPRFAEKLKWELDRFDLPPHRLVVEVLENVVADASNEVSVCNIAALSKLGCGIDLDDFGTGHASITNIRRFAVKRLKIDRSFVTRMDTDRDQQRFVSAMLSMAEQLGLESVAEGVETAGEHALLAQLGCHHVQGFGIARPMPFEDTIAWGLRHHEKLTKPQILGSGAA